MVKKHTILVILFSFLCFSVSATTYYAKTTGGNWGASGTWYTDGCPGTGTTNSTASFPGAADIAVICTGITVNISANSACATLTLQGGTINFNSNSTLAVTGTVNNASGSSLITATNGNAAKALTAANLTVTAGTLTVDAPTFTISSTTSISGSLIFNNNSNVKTFQDAITINNGGSWSSTGITSAGNLVIQKGGITTVGTGSFSAASATFNTNGQTLSGTMSFSGTVTVTGVTVVNNGAVTITTALTGVAGQWTQGLNSTLNFAGNSIGIAAVDFSTNANTVNYNQSGNQTVLDANYYNLVTSDPVPPTTLKLKALAMSTGRTISGTLTVNANARLSVSGAFTLSVLGNSYVYDSLCPTSASTIISLQAVDLSGGVLGGSSNATINVNGNLTLPSGNGLIAISAVTIFGTTDVTSPYGLTLSNSGVKKFVGAITIHGSGTWNSTSITASPNLEIQNGITIGTGNFSAGTAIFTTNSQNLASGSGTYNFSSTVTVSGAITVTNQSASGVTVTGALDGTVAGSGWTNASGSLLIIASNTRPFATAGIMDLSTNPNTVAYTGNACNIARFNHSSLTLNSSGTGSISIALTVSGTLTLTSGSLSNGLYLTMANGATISRGIGSLTTAPTFGATVNLIYTAINATGLEVPTSTSVLNNLTMNTTGGNVNLSSALTVNGVITWLSDGLLDLGNYDLTLVPAASYSSYNANRYFLTSGTGRLVVQGTTSAKFLTTFPVGSGGYYNPLQVSSLAATVTGTGILNIRAVVGREPNLSTAYFGLNKYWAITTSGITAVTVSMNFTYNNAEVVSGSQAAFVPIYWNGSAETTPTGASGAGVNPFSTAGNTVIDGNWTARDPVVRPATTYYSYQSGDWGTANTWTTDATGTTLLNPAVPGAVALDNVVILNGRTVFTTTSRLVGSTTVNSGGVLDLKTSTGHNLGAVSGTGKIRLNSTTFPGGTFTSFTSVLGGTVEYYDLGGVGTNLSTSQCTYNNLLFTNSTVTNNTLIFNNPSALTYNVNGTLTLSATGAGTLSVQLASIANSNITLNVAGALTNGTNCFLTVANQNGFHNVSVGGDFVNNGTVNWANNTQYSAATTGAVNLTFIGSSNNNFTINNTCNVYTLTVNKGVDQTYVLTATASATTYFNVYGPQRVVDVINGTLRLSTNIVLTRLINTGTYDLPSAGNQSACLWIDGANVQTLGTHGIRVYGRLRVTSGTFSTGSSGSHIIMRSNSEVDFEGGTSTITKIDCGSGGSFACNFNMLGGILNVDGTIGDGQKDFSRFAMPNVNANFVMTGGIINVYVPQNSTDNVGGLIQIGVPLGNYTITGGTWNVYIPASSVNALITSTMPFYNLNIFKSGAGSAICKIAKIGGDQVVQAQPLVVLNDFILDNTNGFNPTFDAAGNNVTVGGNFTIPAGATYIPNNNVTTLNGTGAQTFGINTQITTATTLTINKSSGTSAVGGAASFDVLNGLNITQGTFDDGNTNVDIAGNITNNGTHTTGTGSLRIQRGITATSVTAPGSYTLPTVTAASGSGATFALTIKNGVIADINVVSGGSGYVADGNGMAALTFSAGTTTATGIAKCSGGALLNAWMWTGGSGYGPTATYTGSVGSGALLEAVVTGTTGSVAGTGTVTAINILSPGKGYTSASAPTTVTFSSGAATGSVTLGACTISSTGTATFANLTLNNDAGATMLAPVNMTKDLRLASGNLTAGSYQLTLGASSNIYDALAGTSTALFGATKMIRTNALASDGGVVKTFSTTSFVFPVGTGVRYTPASFTFSTAPSVYGVLTIKPVDLEHPLVSATGQALTYYWKTSGSGFTFGPATLTQVYTYDQSDVVDNGGTVTENQYVPGRYNVSLVSWTTNGLMAKVDNTLNTITFDGASFNTSITGDYTSGDQTPSDPFAAVLKFYSLGSGQWTDGTKWSVTSHAGAPANTVPNGNCIAEIGDGITYFHSMTIPSNNQTCGLLRILKNSYLDLGTTTGHDFGTYDTTFIGEGTLRISSSAATAVFPNGDFSGFLSSYGGRLEYYDAGTSFTIPTQSASPTFENLTSARKLILTPGTGRSITMADVNFSVYDSMTVRGASATAMALLNSTSARTLTVGGNLTVSSGDLQFANGTIQNVSVAGDVSVANGALFNVAATGTAVVNTMAITGNLLNNGTFNMSNGTRYCTVTFTGASNTSVTGTGATTTFYNLIVNKGAAQTPVLNVNATAFSLASVAYPNLTLSNGTFRLTSAQTIQISSTGGFTVPQTACLSSAGGTINIGQSNNNNADLFLDGKLDVSAGTVNVGNAGNTSNNDIEYGTSGASEISVTGTGSLNVNGLVRRNTVTAAGSLIFTLSGTGAVDIRGQSRTLSSNTSRALLEVLNAGSQFNMSGASSLTIERGGGSTYYDFYLNPPSYSVTGGTINIGSNAVGTQTIQMYSQIALNNLTVASNSNTAQLVINPLTLNGSLVIGAASTFNANSLDVIVKGNFTNSNATSTSGVATGGYQPGVSTQTTTLSSAAAAQTITGAAGNLTNFGNLVINNTFGSVSLAANSNIYVNGNLTLTTPFADGGSTCTVIGNLANSTTHTSSGAGEILLKGTSQQTISGNGSGVFGNIELNNASGSTFSASQTINGALTITSGIFDINSYLLTLGSSNTLVGAGLGTYYIQTGGALTDLGVTKNFPSGATNYTFHVGCGGKYCPAQYNITANGAAGTINVALVNVKHPATQDPLNKELKFYWNIASTGFSSLTITHTYSYIATDVQGTEASYVTGRFYNNDWTPGGGIAATVNSGTHVITLSGINYIDGDYTAGETTEFASLLTYYSRNATLGGNWDNVNSWSTDVVLKHGGAAASQLPTGNPIDIAAGHTINANGDSRNSRQSVVNGILNLSTYVGHDFGTVTGTGKIMIDKASGGSLIFPGGSYTAFTASGGGTFEFNVSAGTGTMTSQATFDNLTFTGAGIKELSNVNLTVNGALTINAGGGTVNNSTNNRNIDIKGNWVNNSSSTAFTPGTGTVSFSGTGTKTIGGSFSTTFYNLTTNTALSTDIVQLSLNTTISNVLNLTKGGLSLNSNTLSITNSAAGAITRTSPGYILSETTDNLSKVSWTIAGVAGRSYVFPFGVSSAVADYIPVTFVNQQTAASPTISVSTYATPASNLPMPSYASINMGSVYGGSSATVIDRWWDINSTTNPLAAAGADITFSYRGAENTLSAPDQTGTLVVQHWNTSTTAWETPFSGGSIGVTGASVGTVTATGATKFSPYIIGAKAHPLPIELLVFSAVKNGTKVDLNWSTATETNNDYFTVERSLDAVNFETVAIVKGAGNSSTLLKYSAVDEKPLNASSYYRLKQTDFDGSMTYSKIVLVVDKVEGVGQITLFPNPTAAGFSAQLRILPSVDNSVVVLVHDVAGQELFTKVLILQKGMDQVVAIDSEGKLPPGIYFITATSDNSIYNQKLIIR